MKTIIYMFIFLLVGGLLPFPIHVTAADTHIPVPGWSQINPPGFGDSTYPVVKALEVYNGQLYAAINQYSAFSDSAYLQRMNADGTWEKAASFDFFHIEDMQTHGGYLFLGGRFFLDPGNTPAIFRFDGSQVDWITTTYTFGEANQKISQMFEYAGVLYAATKTTGGAGFWTELWYCDTTTCDTWHKLYSGDDLASNDSIPTFSVFDNVAYAGMSGGEIYRCDPVETGNACTTSAGWVSASTAGFGAPHPSFGALAVFTSQDRLFAGINSSAGAQIWYCNRADDCDTNGDWLQVTDPSWNPSGGYLIRAMGEFNNQFYVILDEVSLGIQVWRSVDGISWEKFPAAPDGFGDESHVAETNAALTIFNNLFIVGTYNESLGGGVWATSGDAATLSLIVPVDGARLKQRNPMLDWTDVSGTEGYQLQLASRVDFSRLVKNYSGLTASEKIITGLAAKKTYYWRVRTLVGGVWSDWAEARSFIVSNPPKRPTLLRPVNGTVVKTALPTLRWTVSSRPRAAYFKLQVDNDLTMNSPIVNVDHAVGRRMTLDSPLDNNVRYYWRVMACNLDDECGPWSRSFNFITRAARVDLKSPEHLAIVAELRPTFEWSGVTNDTTNRYEIRIGRGVSAKGNVTRIIKDTWVTGLTYTINKDLLPHTNYYWQVRSKGMGGNNLGLWSDARSFNVSP
jgi:hypothetical protein